MKLSSRRVLLLLAAAPGFLLGSANAQPRDIPWDRSVVISRTSAGEDIKAVLRSLAQAGGLAVSFAPNVDRTVSFRMDKVPAHEAFEELIEDNGLSYTYNASTRTIHVAALAGSGGVAALRPSAFVPLDNVTFAEVSQAMANFGIPPQGIRYDATSRTVGIAGDAERVQQVKDLIASLEAARQKQRDRAGEERERELKFREAELTQKIYEDLSRFQVKVVPLRFTDVGPTTKTFQGRTVTIPGIEDTLKSILGLDGAAQAAQAPAQGTEAPSNLLRAQQLGFPRISIDQRTNSVVIHGTPEAILAIEKIINELDRPLQMVEIEVVIATAEKGVARELGISWRASQFEPDGTPRSSAVDTGTSGNVIGNTPGGTNFNTTGLDALNLLPPASAAGGTVASFVVRGAQAALQAQLQALASDDKARVLSAPRLVTLDNITARITRSQNIYVQVDTRSAEGGGLGGVGLEEIQTGLTLEITPSVVPPTTAVEDGLVRLNLRAENSAPGTGSFGQIDVRSQEVQTNVLVPDGATFVIGGLFDDTQISTETGVPGLKDIPLLGALFRNTNATKTLGETIFFITPRIIDERVDLQNDIAVKVGSEEYIRQERRALETVHEHFNRATPSPALDAAPAAATIDGPGVAAPRASVRNLEEDE
jgi:type II secretory pathway component GspD/PulD (secretin)